MRVADLVKQKDARVKLCEILNALRAAGFTGTINFASESGIVSTLAAANVPIRWDSDKSLFKARG
jgi:hypothetical protein